MKQITKNLILNIIIIIIIHIKKLLVFIDHQKLKTKQTKQTNKQTKNK